MTERKKSVTKKKNKKKTAKYTPEDRLVHSKAWRALRDGGMTAYAAADHIGVPYATLKYWENAAKKKAPTKKTVIAPLTGRGGEVTLTTSSGHIITGSRGDVLFILQHLGV